VKKKLLVILGAGSSVEQGVPSVRDIDAKMAAWARKWAAETGYQDYFGKLWWAISKYYSEGDRRYRPGPDFEKVLGEMVALSHWMTPAPWGDTLRQTACGGCAPPDLEFPVDPFTEHAPYNATIAIEDQKDTLLAALARHMRAESLAIDRAGEPANRYKRLIDGLRESFDLGIYNLNYDTAAINAWPEAYSGFGESGQFDPQTVHRRAEWNFIYHLHGSVHHSLSHEHGGDIRWRNDLTDAAHFFDKPVTSTNDKRSEGRSFSRGTLIAGGYKLDQLLTEPFHSFQAALIRHVYNADAILVGGYGFADVHINRALQNRVGSVAGRVPVMVLDYATPKADPMMFRHDSWANELSGTLAAPGDFFRGLRNPSAPSPNELAAEKAFEVSAPHKVAIWHAGFTSAATAIDRISRWLSGEADTVLARTRAIS
jgi:SIR2-like domain